MLYEQIPSRLRDRVATELKLDLKVLSTTLSEEPSEATKVSRLKIVNEYIEKNETIGTVDKPDRFFRGNMRLSWGPYPDQESQMVYFGGMTQHTILGLAGSLKYVIGEIGRSEVDMSSYISIPGSSLPDTF